jgi:hypothetical protein
MTIKEFKQLQKEYWKQLPPQTKKIIKAIRKGELTITNITISNAMKTKLKL